MAKTNEAIRTFEVYTGGKDDIPITKTAAKGPTDGDWLRALPVETRFLCHGKNNRGCFLDNYGIVQVLPEAILLYNFMASYGLSPYSYVDSAKFSRDHIHFANINPPIEEGNNEHHLLISEPRKVDD